jgi:DNA-directed RNA polymerase subunit RPC12/RpoP
MASTGILRIRCPDLRCRCILAVPAETRGKVLRCARCGTKVLVPQPKEANPREAAAAGDDSG